MSSASIYGHTIAQVESPVVGIHLLWMGPHTWIYSTGGWFIQRRKYKRQEEEKLCAGLDSEGIERLSREGESRLNFGTLIMREGTWPTYIVQDGPEIVSTCKVFTLELDKVERAVFVEAHATASFVIALYEEKVVATSGPSYGLFSHELRSFAIDKVLVYWQNQSPSFLEFCIPIPSVSDEENWNQVPYIVKGLQLPIQEINPVLNNPDEELAEARRRLIDGESIDHNDFKRLANTLRACVKKARPPRPIDQVLLLRNNIDDSFEELIGLDPLRTLISHPKWRRVLGFGWFDSDQSLEVGETYEYRITGYFPSEDLYDIVYGFHTIPSKTLLPSEFFLGNLRLQIPQPVTVELSPATVYSDLVQVTRRGIELRPKEEHYWIRRYTGNWSLIVDFPTSTSLVMLELDEDHTLEYSWRLRNGTFTNLIPVPSGSNPVLNFSSTTLQLRLRGKGFLYAIRIISETTGVSSISVVLPPVTLLDTARPDPPLTAVIANLQQPQLVVQDNTPPPVTLPRHDLGFEIQWRPAPRSGLSIWPSDLIPAPPLDAAIFQLERRQMQQVRGLPTKLADVVGALTDPANLPSPSRMSRSSKMGSDVFDNIGNISITLNDRNSLIAAIASSDLDTITKILYFPKTDWQSLLPDENYIVGNRNNKDRSTSLFPGVDVMYLFPEQPRRPSGAGLNIYFKDVFMFGDNPGLQDVPSPGTYHQYRIAAIDQIGRPSLTHRETNILRLEKHVPPPVPVGPKETTDTPTNNPILPEPTGVQARILVKDAPDLAADDKLRLGTHSNIILLTWGWHEKQRKTDPFATEFRVYFSSRPLDSISGTLTSVRSLWPGVYDVTINL